MSLSVDGFAFQSGYIFEYFFTWRPSYPYILSFLVITTCHIMFSIHLNSEIAQQFDAHYFVLCI